MGAARSRRVVGRRPIRRGQSPRRSGGLGLRRHPACSGRGDRAAWPSPSHAFIDSVHHVRDLLPVDITEHNSLQVTTPSRTLLDSAPRLTKSQLEEALDGACQRGQIYLPYLSWRLSELRKQGRPGVRRVDELISRSHQRQCGDSWLESAILRLLHDAGLPPPRTQVTSRPGGGGRRIRVDCLWDEQRLVVEVDGHGTHATRRQRQADAERDARLQLDGWRVIRFTYEDVVERPEHVVGLVARMLGLDVAPLRSASGDGSRGGGTDSVTRTP